MSTPGDGGWRLDGYPERPPIEDEVPQGVPQDGLPPPPPIISSPGPPGWVVGAIVLGAMVVVLVGAFVVGRTLDDSGDEAADRRRSPAGINQESDDDPATTPTTRRRTTTSSTPETTAAVPSPPPPAIPDEVVLAVGEDIQPGRYMAGGGDGFFCSWERVSGFGGSFDEVIAFGANTSHVIVDVLESDAGLQSQGCGEWVPYSAPASPATAFEDGDWLVGSDIAAGTYRNIGTSAAVDCAWERASGFAHDFDEITAYDFTSEPVVVELHAGERFTAMTCGAWTLQ